MSGGWTPAEVERLAAALARPDGTPDCPRCGARLERRRVRPRRDVAYVRDRILLVCGSCGARGALDRREIERRRAGRDGPDAEGSEGNASAEDGGAGNGGS